MRKSIVTVLAFVSVFLVCCKSKNDSIFLCDVKDYDSNSCTSVELKGKLVPVEILGASQIAVCDTFLVVLTSNKNAMFSVVGLKSEKLLAEFGTEGQSRIEFLYPSIDDKEFKYDSGHWLMRVTEQNDGSLKYVDLTESVIQGKTVISYVKENEYEYNKTVVDLPDGRKLMFSSESEGYYLNSPIVKIIDDSVETVIPVYAEKKISYDDDDLYTSILLWSNKIVHDRNMSHIGFVNVIGSVVYLDVNTQKAFYLNDKSRSMDDFKFMFSSGEDISPDFMAQTDALATDKYIFMLMQPLVRTDDEDGAKSEVRVFDWDGNYIMNIRLDQTVSFFSYDEHTDVLYVLDTVMEGIYAYELNEVLN